MKAKVGTTAGRQSTCAGDRGLGGRNRGRERDRGVRGYALATSIVLMLAAGTGQACTLGSEVYKEAEPASSYWTVLKVVQALTGKGWKELTKKEQGAVLNAITDGTPTHVLTDLGEVSGIETLLESTSLRSGRYRVSDVDDVGQFLKIRIGRSSYYIEERYGCYSTYSYDILIWEGYGGQMCSEDDYDTDFGSC